MRIVRAWRACSSDVETNFFTVHDVSHNHKKEYLGSWIADVSSTDLQPVGCCCNRRLKCELLVRDILHVGAANMRGECPLVQQPLTCALRVLASLPSQPQLEWRTG